MTDASNLLPIGSVVLLQNGQKKVMITGFYTVAGDNPDKIYDYIGCLFPEGVISSDKNLLFNHNQIAQIFYTGFRNDEEVEFKQKLKTAMVNMNNPSSMPNVNNQVNPSVNN